MSKCLRVAVTVSTVLMVAAAAASGQGVQSDDQAIAALGGSDQRACESAVDYVRRNVPPALRSERLETALVKELARLNEIRRVRRERDRVGEPLGDDFSAEYYAEVIQVVGQSSSPTAIEALTGALGTGAMVESALSKFGDAAVPATAIVAQATVGTVMAGSPGDTPPDVVAGAITTLAKILASGRPISAASRSTILSIARDRLTGRQHGEVVIAATRLAAASADRTLLQRVARLAADPQEIRAMGVTDPWMAQQVQRAAQSAVAGR